MRFFFEFEHILLERHEHYQKGSYRNRCYIGSTTGPQMLSIPLLKGKHQQLPITEVKIAYHTTWYAQHWHSIQTAYGSAPFFMHYSDQIHEILYTKYEKLWDLNRAILQFLLEMFQAPAIVHETPEYDKKTEPLMEDKRGAIQPGNHFELPQYNQVFMDRMGFQSNLSALDLLMHLGPEGYGYLNAPFADRL
jgi:hypothetical protein